MYDDAERGVAGNTSEKRGRKMNELSTISIEMCIKCSGIFCNSVYSSRLAQDELKRLLAEIERLRGEVEKALKRGYETAITVCQKCCYEKGQRIENVTYDEAKQMGAK